jgi:hypothetical protein
MELEDARAAAVADRDPGTYGAAEQVRHAHRTHGAPGATEHASPAHGHPHAGGHPHAAGPQPWAAAAAAPPTRLGRVLARLGAQPAWLAPLALLGCLGAAVGYVAANDPTDATRDPLAPCLFRTLTGLDCPGCGGTRMVWYLLHGNLPEAARHHLVALLLVPFVVYGYLAWTASRLFGTRSWRPGRVFWLTVAVAWIAFTVLRNLPFEPFLSFRV